jgi:hypothetical protein
MTPFAHALREIVVELDYDLAKEVDVAEDHGIPTWEDLADKFRQVAIAELDKRPGPM